MNPVERLRTAPRCTATSKRTGNTCRCPAVRGWTVCRFHGAGGGAPKGMAHGRYVHGRRTGEARDIRRELSELTLWLKEVAPTVLDNC